jgi:ATP-dependent DNA ligase
LIIKPMECLSAKKLPRGEQWTYEIKLDGFRVEALSTADSSILYSKQGKLLTSQFMQVALELEELPRERRSMVNWSPWTRMVCLDSTCFRTTAADQPI